MNDKFEALQTDFSSLEANLSLQLPFFSKSGNCFLLAETAPLSFRLLKAYESLCKLELSYEETNILKTFVPLYRNHLALLALEMQADLNDNDLKTALDRTAPLVSGDYIIQQFALIRQQIQKLLTRYYSIIVCSYSLKQVPVVTMQGLILDRIDEISNYTIEMFLDFDGLKKEGVPNLEKIKDQENKNHKLKIDISAQSEILDKIYWLEDNLEEDMGYEAIYESVLQSLSDIYYAIYGFYYEQLFTNRIPLQNVIANAKLKFPEVTNMFISRTQEIFKIVEAGMSLPADKQAFSQICRDFSQRINKIIQTFPIFNFDQPKIYNLIFRQATDFEKKVYSPFFSVDAQLLSATPDENGMIISSFVINNSSKLLDYAAILILGENYNRLWQTKIINDVNSDLIDKLKQRADEIGLRNAANYSYNQRITNYMIGDI